MNIKPKEVPSSSKKKPIGFLERRRLKSKLDKVDRFEDHFDFHSPEVSDYLETLLKDYLEKRGINLTSLLVNPNIQEMFMKEKDGLVLLNYVCNTVRAFGFKENIRQKIFRNVIEVAGFLSKKRERKVTKKALQIFNIINDRHRYCTDRWRKVDKDIGDDCDSIEDFARQKGVEYYAYKNSETGDKPRNDEIKVLVDFLIFLEKNKISSDIRGKMLEIFWSEASKPDAIDIIGKEQQLAKT